MIRKSAPSTSLMLLVLADLIKTSIWWTQQEQEVYWKCILYVYKLSKLKLGILSFSPQGSVLISNVQSFVGHHYFKISFPFDFRKSYTCVIIFDFFCMSYFLNGTIWIETMDICWLVLVNKCSEHQFGMNDHSKQVKGGQYKEPFIFTNWRRTSGTF